MQDAYAQLAVLRHAGENHKWLEETAPAEPKGRLALSENHGEAIAVLLFEFFRLSERLSELCGGEWEGGEGTLVGGGRFVGSVPN